MPALINVVRDLWPQMLESAALFVAATFVFDVIHFILHRCLSSRRRVLRRLAGLHQAHHDFFDAQMHYHEDALVPNLVWHVTPEYATQMAVCALAFFALDPMPVFTVMAVFTVLFGVAMVLRGKDYNHVSYSTVPVPRGVVLVRAPYHALHHAFPDNYLSSYTTLFDRVVGTACQIRGRRVAITGASGSFGSAMKSLLERAGALVVALKYGVDYTYEDYSGADPVLASADILILAHGAKGEQAMAANCDSFLALIARFKVLTRERQLPAEVWAVGSEIEFHPAFGDRDLETYARAKRSYARAAAGLMHDPHLLYRHIVPSAFSSRMGPGLMSGHTAATIAFWLIRRGFRYVPVTYTGIAFLNFIPFFLRGLLTGSGRVVGHRPHRSWLADGPGA
jgi:hypothetical protein